MNVFNAVLLRLRELSYHTKVTFRVLLVYGIFLGSTYFVFPEISIISDNIKHLFIPRTGILNNVLLQRISPIEYKDDQQTSNRIISEHVFPHPYKYITTNSDFCSRGNSSTLGKLSLIILVFTSLENLLQRQTIRETWGSVAAISNNTGNVRVGFLLGTNFNLTLQAKIVEESLSHSDIIQEDFFDSYKNLTLKSVMLLKWATSFCPNVHFMLKTDDDMFINIPKLLETLENVPQKTNIMYGSLFPRSYPWRDLSSKWYVPKAQFKGVVYPPFLSGTGYVISGDVIPSLLNASYSIPFLVVEDVFITGLCAEKAGVRRVGIKGFSTLHRNPTGCSFKDAISGHHVTPNEMIKIWKELQGNIICASPNT